jgi:hypothetical protein
MPMPRRHPARAGSVTKLCACGNSIQVSQVCCPSCWQKLPRDLQFNYLTAKDGDCGSGRALEKAAEEIRQRVKEMQL